MLGTKNFTIETDSMIMCRCGHELCEQTTINQFTLERLQMMRDDLGAPMIITSGGRCPHHPAERGKKGAGDHQLGWGVDLQCKSQLEANKLLVLAGRYGATRAALGQGFIHLAWTPTTRRDVPTWSYNNGN